MRSFTVDQRRARLGHRHGFANALPDVTSVAEAMIALHASDPATVYLSAVARLSEPSLDAMTHALYDKRSVVRVLGMRRTLFVVSIPTLSVVERSSTDSVAVKERRRLERYLVDGGITEPTAWLDSVAAKIQSSVPTQGMTAREITQAVPELATKIVMRAGSEKETAVGSTSRVLGVLASEGLLQRGRPRGAWTGRQYQWHLRHEWLESQDGANGTSGDPTRQMDEQTASTELLRRWLHVFGPAPLGDMTWWTGWTMAKVRAILNDLETVDVDLDGQPGLVMADDLDTDPTPDTWVALLPSLDPTPMGWTNRDWYLGPHRDRLFDRNGNIGPTVWIDGRIVGGWGQRPNGDVVTSVLEDIGSDHAAMIEQRAAELTRLLETTVVKPSFPTPLQSEIAG